MFRNYLKFAFRNLYKNRTYSIISLCGLAVGMAAFIMMALYVQYEYNWDTFNQYHEKIVRLEQKQNRKHTDKEVATTPYPLAPLLKANFPEIIDTVRFYRIWSVTLSSSKEKTFLERGMTGYYVDNSLFNIFTIEFIKGSPKTALMQPYSIVITEETAEKYFPGQDPLGKILRFDKIYDGKVTGVVKNPPPHSHFKYRILVSMPTLDTFYRLWDVAGDWDTEYFFTYLLLKDRNSIASLEPKIRDFLNQFRDKTKRKSQSQLYLKPLSMLHFSQTEFELSENTDRVIPYLFSAIALFILLVACVNFMNLSTAYSVTRAKEIGVRKVVGGRRSLLIRQFLGESIFYSLLSMVFALMLVELFLPVFNDIVLRELELQLFSQWQFTGFMLIIALGVGLISGIYPGLVLSSFEPVRVFKGVPKLGNKRALFSKILIVFQFVISFILISSTAIIFEQLNFIKNKDLGFDQRAILVNEISHARPDVLNKYRTLKDQLIKTPYVLKASISRQPLLYGYDVQPVRWEGASPNDTMDVVFNVVDHDFVDTFGIQIEEGRNFSRSFPSDKDNTCIINETAVHVFGWQSPKSAIGKKVFVDRHPFTVIGVAKDFHMYTLYRRIPPFVMFLHGERMQGYAAFSMKLPPHNLAGAKAYTEKKFKEFFPGEVIDLVFIEEFFDKGYREALGGVGKVFGFFSFLTIFIAAMGLFSLVSFSANRRTKEIGIRKALGASISRIFVMLVKQFLKLLAIAIVIGWPITYFIMNRVLQVMPYRADIHIGFFLLAAFISFLIVMVTVSSKSMSAARANPVEALRYE